MEDKVLKTESGRWIVAHWDNRTQQWITFDCRDGFTKAFAPTIEKLAKETGRTYSTKAAAIRVARECYLP